MDKNFQLPEIRTDFEVDNFGNQRTDLVYYLEKFEMYQHGFGYDDWNAFWDDVKFQSVTIAEQIHRIYQIDLARKMSLIKFKSKKKLDLNERCLKSV